MLQDKDGSSNVKSSDIIVIGNSPRGKSADDKFPSLHHELDNAINQLVNKYDLGGRIERSPRFEGSKTYTPPSSLSISAKQLHPSVGDKQSTYSPITTKTYLGIYNRRKQLSRDYCNTTRTVTKPTKTGSYLAIYQEKKATAAGIGNHSRPKNPNASILPKIEGKTGSSPAIPVVSVKASNTPPLVSDNVDESASFERLVSISVNESNQSMNDTQQTIPTSQSRPNSKSTSDNQTRPNSQHRPGIQTRHKIQSRPDNQSRPISLSKAASQKILVSQSLPDIQQKQISESRPVSESSTVSPSRYIRKSRPDSKTKQISENRPVSQSRSVSHSKSVGQPRSISQYKPDRQTKQINETRPSSQSSTDSQTKYSSQSRPTSQHNTIIKTTHTSDSQSKPLSPSTSISHSGQHSKSKHERDQRQTSRTPRPTSPSRPGVRARPISKFSSTSPPSSSSHSRPVSQSNHTSQPRPAGNSRSISQSSPKIQSRPQSQSNPQSQSSSKSQARLASQSKPDSQSIYTDTHTSITFIRPGSTHEVNADELDHSGKYIKTSHSRPTNNVTQATLIRETKTKATEVDLTEQPDVPVRRPTNFIKKNIAISSTDKKNSKKRLDTSVAKKLSNIKKNVPTDTDMPNDKIMEVNVPTKLPLRDNSFTKVETETDTVSSPIPSLSQLKLGNTEAADASEAEPESPVSVQPAFVQKANTGRKPRIGKPHKVFKTAPSSEEDVTMEHATPKKQHIAANADTMHHIEANMPHRPVHHIPQLIREKQLNQEVTDDIMHHIEADPPEHTVEPHTSRPFIRPGSTHEVNADELDHSGKYIKTSHSRPKNNVTQATQTKTKATEVDLTAEPDVPVRRPTNFIKKNIARFAILSTDEKNIKNRQATSVAKELSNMEENVPTDMAMQVPNDTIMEVNLPTKPLSRDNSLNQEVNDDIKHHIEADPPEHTVEPHTSRPFIRPGSTHEVNADELDHSGKYIKTSHSRPTHNVTQATLIRETKTKATEVDLTEKPRVPVKRSTNFNKKNVARFANLSTDEKHSTEEQDTSVAKRASSTRYDRPKCSGVSERHPRKSAHQANRKTSAENSIKTETNIMATKYHSSQSVNQVNNQSKAIPHTDTTSNEIHRLDITIIGTDQQKHQYSRRDSPDTETNVSKLNEFDMEVNVTTDMEVNVPTDMEVNVPTQLPLRDNSFTKVETETDTASSPIPSLSQLKLGNTEAADASEADPESPVSVQPAFVLKANTGRKPRIGEPHTVFKTAPSSEEDVTMEHATPKKQQIAANADTMHHIEANMPHRPVHHIPQLIREKQLNQEVNDDIMHHIEADPPEHTVEPHISRPFIRPGSTHEVNADELDITQAALIRENVPTDTDMHVPNDKIMEENVPTETNMHVPNDKIMEENVPTDTDMHVPNDKIMEENVPTDTDMHVPNDKIMEENVPTDTDMHVPNDKIMEENVPTDTDMPNDKIMEVNVPTKPPSQDNSFTKVETETDTASSPIPSLSQLKLGNTEAADASEAELESLVSVQSAIVQKANTERKPRIGKPSDEFIRALKSEEDVTMEPTVANKQQIEANTDIMQYMEGHIPHPPDDPAPPLNTAKQLNDEINDEHKTHADIMHHTETHMPHPPADPVPPLNMPKQLKHEDYADILRHIRSRPIYMHTYSVKRLIRAKHLRHKVNADSMPHIKTRPRYLLAHSAQPLNRAKRRKRVSFVLPSKSLNMGNLEQQTRTSTSGGSIVHTCWQTKSPSKNKSLKSILKNSIGNCKRTAELHVGFTVPPDSHQTTCDRVAADCCNVVSLNPKCDSGCKPSFPDDLIP